MHRLALPAALVMGCLFPAMLLAAQGDPGTTLVLPLRTIGISETTAVVVRALLAGELEARRVQVRSPFSSAPAQPSGAEACADADCAAKLAAEHQAAQVVYGSLSKLGGKVLVRMSALRAGEETPYYTDQFSALSEDDLDAVMRRVAEGIASGRANSDRVSVESITQAESIDPRRRAARSGFGVRAGFLYPMGDSYARRDRLTNFRVAYKFEGTNFLVETTPILGWSATGDVVDWTLLDFFGARVFGLGDMASYAGGGLGLHRVSIHRQSLLYSPFDSEWDYREQTATTLAADLGGGLLLFRTFNFQLLVDLRYHVVFDSFTRVGGDGAHGILLSFGISR